MGAALSLCIVDDSWEPEEVFIQKILKRYLDSGEAKLLLSIASPLEQPSAAGRGLFSPHDRISELWVETLQVAKGWAPLRWRYGAAGASREGQGSGGEERAAGGQGLRFWRAKVVAALASGDERSQWCLLQVATVPAERTMENAMLDRRDAQKVAGFAQRFNQHMLRGAGAGDLDSDGMPSVSVCVPVVCRVLQSPVPQFFARGDAVQLLPYTASEVTKFVFDGHEDYNEIPHAFFHYVTWSTGGNECVSDLQGNEEENGSVTLVNPCMPRPFAFGSGLFFDRANAGAAQAGAAARLPAPSPQMFEALHPRCGQLCRTFDPERRARPVRRHCGVAACGLTPPGFGAGRAAGPAGAAV